MSKTLKSEQKDAMKNVFTLKSFFGVLFFMSMSGRIPAILFLNFILQKIKILRFSNFNFPKKKNYDFEF